MCLKITIFLNSTKLFLKILKRVKKRSIQIFKEVVHKISWKKAHVSKQAGGQIGKPKGWCHVMTTKTYEKATCVDP